jgi:transposase
MKDRVTLTTREQKRVLVLQRMERGEMTAAEAATVVAVSVRQVRRLLAGYRREGVAALAHGNRGRRPAHVIPPQVRQQVLAVATTQYAGANFQHLRDLLEQDGIVLSRASVRRILLGAGVPSPRTCRRRTHRRRRERRAQEGALVQIDGSPQAWLEGRGPHLTLLVALDDATGKILAALLRGQEDTHGYLLLLRQLVATHGCPLALYHDRHGIFQVNPARPETLEEHLAGQRAPTQFGRALQELEITSIAAQSPQAKGRVERLFGTLQERLVVALRMAGATTLEEANALLPAFLAAYNARFAVPAADPRPCYRPFVPLSRRDEICCFKYVRTVAADNTVRLGPHTLQILPARSRLSYVQARVEVHERLAGSRAVYYQGRCLATQEAPPAAPAVRARAGRALGAPPRPPAAPTPGARESAAPTPGARESAAPAGPRHPARPAPDHPWRRTVRRAAGGPGERP